MEFDLSWILLGLPLAFGLGWLASRMDLRQLRLENRQTPKAYFKGLNYLLNEQQDQAIDAFIEAVQHDPDTSELHFALGNLFRRRGEYERAVRVHQHLLSRADLTQTDRDRAQYALAQDYLKAGLLDRAEDALTQLEGTAHASQAHLALLAIYERSRDWAKASAVAQKLSDNGQGSFHGRQAHYLCEQAAALDITQDSAPVIALLQQAIQIAPQGARARMALAKTYEDIGKPQDAYATLETLATQVPSALPLLAPKLAALAQKLNSVEAALQLLETSYAKTPSLDVLGAIVLLRTAKGETDTSSLYAKHLEREPSLVAATQWVANEKFEHEQFHPQVQRALERAAKPLQRYRCAACGFEATQHFWQCPGCQAWDSYPARRVEEL
ncbi:lipopolysaccharide assembly protein LapB [Limnohabitans sp. TS-CS-82]|uniref:lipopolysaccharide assembly protein LapB n=1 Tax=Limnohabitans sp. TS-CS-82 TaxID=2094193 RepID=UPI000CF2EDC6|nr:lipopolysaccharide assembly protein LapB [Limnohabitans sp. TS-CS-82]PQA82715.1 lipopolysaccharide assembly protein LapB [Limnohabitans sp. TS-CS-82]